MRQEMMDIHLKVCEVRDLIRKAFPDAIMDDIDIDISIVDKCEEGYTKIEVSIDGSCIEDSIMGFEHPEYFEEAGKYESVL